jgi:hypothetical protein
MGVEESLVGEALDYQAMANSHGWSGDLVAPR